MLLALSKAVIEFEPPEQQHAAAVQLRQYAVAFEEKQRSSGGTGVTPEELREISSSKVINAIAFVIGKTITMMRKGEKYSTSVLFNLMETLCRLLQGHPQNKTVFISIPEGIQALVALCGYSQEQVASYACRAIWCLCWDFPPGKQRLVQHSGDKVLAQCLPNPKTGIRGRIPNPVRLEMVCGAIWAATFDHEEYQSQFAGRHVLESLAAVLQCPKASPRLMYVSMGAFTSLLWNHTENQRRAEALVPPILARVAAMDPWTASAADQRAVGEQALELVSAYTYLHDIEVDAYWPKKAVALLGSANPAIRVQACSCIYSMCVGSPAMQSRVGVEHEGVLALVRLMEGNLLDRFMALVALGGLLRECPETQTLFTTLHTSKQGNVLPGLGELVKYLVQNLAKEQKKLSFVIEALYNMSVPASPCRPILAHKSSNVMLLLLHIMVAPSTMQSMRVLVLDALRVLVDGNPAAASQIPAEVVTKMTEHFVQIASQTGHSDLCEAYAALLHLLPVRLDTQGLYEAAQRQ